MPNYNPSTIGRIGDIAHGIVVETSVFNNLAYFHQDQWELFNVYGRIWLRFLFVEAITDNGAGATTVQFNATWTTPVIAVNAMCAASASIAAMKAGTRVMYQGGAVATAATITDGAAVSDVIPATGSIIGGKDFIGTIGMVTAAADAASGTSQAVCCYFPLSEGAYVTANI